MNLLTFGIKISIFFGLISAVISYICGYFVGNENPHIFKIVSIVFIANFTIAFVCFNILKLEIPEIINLVSSISTTENKNTQYTTVPSSDRKTEDISNKSSTKTIKENQKDDDNYMTIENTKVKNEPELMAKAIKTMLSKDEE